MSGDTLRDLKTIKEEFKRELLLDGGLRRSSSNNPYLNDIGEFSAGKLPNPCTLPLSLSEKEDVVPTDFSQRFAGFGLEIISSVTSCLISHPCIVLRRQCQVNGRAGRYHLSPFTLLPIIIKLQNRQSFKVLWKGASGVFILKGCSVALETGIAELTPFPREVSVNSSLKHLVQNLMLKSISVALLTPFYCASLLETVQSDIASEKPGVLDCLKEGVRRLFRWGAPQSSRLLPIWQLILPTAAHGLLNYIITSLVHSITMWLLALPLQRDREKFGAIPRSNQRVSEKYLNELTAMFWGGLLANVVLYPAETVLHRLYLQGTRTIIDNLDSGISVLPVITKYEGVFDCFNTIVREEGAAGLYKGFGSLILEYALQALILKAACMVLPEVSSLFRSSRKNTDA